MRLFKFNLFPLYFIILFLCGCQKNDNVIRNCSLGLLLENNEKKVRLTWDQADVTNFEGYLIERSREAFYTPNIGVDTLTVIQDIHQSEFIDSFPLVAYSNHYRVSVLAGKKTVCSSVNDISLDYFFIESDAFEFAFSEESDAIFIAEAFNPARILRYEYKNETITHQVDSVYGVLPKQLCVSHFNNQEELLVVTGTNQVQIFDSGTLGLLERIETSFPLKDVAAKDGLIYLMTDEPYSLLVYDRSTLDSLNHIFDSSFENYGEMAALTGGEKRIGLYLLYKTMVLRFSSSGSLLEKTINPVLAFAGLPPAEIVFSSDGKYSMASRSGLMIDENFIFVSGLIGSLSPWTPLSASEYVFDPTSNFIYAFTFQTMKKYNVSLFDRLPIDETQLPYRVLRAFRSKDDKMIVVADIFEPGNQIYVDVLDFK